LRATSSVLKEGGMFARCALLFLKSFQTALMLSLLLAVPFSANGQPRHATDDGRCQLEPGGESTVLVISGPNTLHLADGRMVHLAEIITPTNAQNAQGGSLDQSSSATAYLRANVLGRKVEIKFGGNRCDRYGATVAHIFVAGERPLWLQEVDLPRFRGEVRCWVSVTDVRLRRRPPCRCSSLVRPQRSPFLHPGPCAGSAVARSPCQARAFCAPARACA
jgi:hypothetical protein